MCHDGQNGQTVGRPSDTVAIQNQEIIRACKPNHLTRIPCYIEDDNIWAVNYYEGEKC